MPRAHLAILLVLGAVLCSTAHAEGPLLTDDTWRVRAPGPLTVDGGLILGLPTAFSTGLSTGVGAGATFGRRIAWGVRASWSSATESSIDWTVARADFKLRAAVAVQHDAGRGRLALRLGLGPTFVHEDRVRNQGMRAGLTGTDLETSAWAALPAADLEAVVGVHIAGPWLLTMSGGPSVVLSDGAVHGGWVAQLGAGWQP
jgi:hypothetical protein